MTKHTDPQEKFQWLTTAPIPGLVGQLAVPTVISMPVSYTHLTLPTKRT